MIHTLDSSICTLSDQHSGIPWLIFGQIFVWLMLYLYCDCLSILLYEPQLFAKQPSSLSFCLYTVLIAMERIFKISGSLVAQSCLTLCDPMDCSTPGFPVHLQLWELTQTYVRRVGDAIQPSHPLSSPSPPAFNLSQHQGLFQWVSSSHQVAKVLSFNFTISPSNKYSGLISFRMDWLDLLAVQGTLMSLLQHHNWKASILQCSAFFIVQLSHPYMTTGKTIALTRRTFVGKVMCLLFNMLSRLVIVFLPRSKHLLISWLQSPSAVILEPPPQKSLTLSIVSPSICHEVMASPSWTWVWGSSRSWW